MIKMAMEIFISLEGRLYLWTYTMNFEVTFKVTEQRALLKRSRMEIK